MFVPFLIAAALFSVSCVSQPSSLSEEPQPEANPEFIETSPYDRVSAALLIGNVDAAIAAYDEVSASDPDSFEAQILLARLYIVAGEAAEARKILNAVPAEDSNYVDSLLGMALVERLQNDKEAERAVLLEVISQEPEHPQANALLGELFLEDGYSDRAEQYFETALSQEPDNFLALQGLGNTYIRNGKLKEAIQAFSNAIVVDPDYSYTYMDRAKVYSSQGYYEGAVTDADTAIELDAENGWHYFDRGKIHARNGSFELARDDFDQAISRIPDIFLFYALRAQIHGFLAEYEAALNDYNRALAMRPDYYPAYPYVAALEYIHGNYNRAHEYFHDASLSGEYNAVYVLFAGIALLAESEFEGKKYLSNNLHLLDRDGLLYKVGRFYTDGYDSAAIYGLQRETDDQTTALAQFYLALRYFQLGQGRTSVALLTSSEQSRLDGLPESLVRDWLIDESTH